ncbi:Nucleic acid-binding, OB-fold [Sesbania bispinosa]|nr:Nucleic acid-binding, OB-fold [Sesbania bispinosa]
MALVSAGYHIIESLCGRRQNWRLKVKLVRMWNMASVATLDDPYALQISFVDEKGGRIEGTVQKHNMLKFSRLMVEGHVYKVSRFGIIQNGGKFRAAGHDYKIIFNSNTQVSPCKEASIPHPGFAFSKTFDIKKTKGSLDYLLDFMGMVTAVSGEIRLNKEERVTRLVLLDLVEDMTSRGDYPVRRVCCDNSILTEYTDCVEDETPLKLKFAPLFTKIQQEEGNKCVLSLSPQCKRLLTDSETTPSSVGHSSSAGVVRLVAVVLKRNVEESVDESWELNKRVRGKGVKIEGD